MKVVMLKSVKGSVTGIDVQLFEKDKIYDSEQMGEALYKSFRKMGAVKQYKETEVEKKILPQPVQEKERIKIKAMTSEKYSNKSSR